MNISNIFGVFLSGIVILSTNSCSKCGSGSGMPGPTQNIKKGDLLLNDSTQYWVDSIDQALVFSNQINNIITFTSNGLINSIEKQNIGFGYSVADGECESHSNQDYYSYPIQDKIFKGNLITITIRRTKYYWDLNALVNSPQNKDKTQDGLEVNLNNYNFSIYPKDRWVTARYKYFDTVTLGNKFYANVIYTYYDTTGLSYLRPETHPYGVYYIIPKGVVGFEFSNGDRYFAK
ncbi:MAG: hypothetical protein Q8M15_11915 [Bacteroidota bacterium]|nr:hypothetical protein [Bacteroidota bacterium]